MGHSSSNAVAIVNAEVRGAERCLSLRQAWIVASESALCRVAYDLVRVEKPVEFLTPNQHPSADLDRGQVAGSNLVVQRASPDADQLGCLFRAEGHPGFGHGSSVDPPAVDHLARSSARRLVGSWARSAGRSRSSSW